MTKEFLRSLLFLGLAMLCSTLVLDATTSQRLASVPAGIELA